jgi:DNA-binding winged helix-turn-helix (wHTH) protein/tetratricopeptide (TPR) repeat protein
LNDAVRVAADLMTTADLAARGDFTLGLAVVSPSTRTIAGPGGTADIEPRVMQVLLVLADAAGQVVTRETLFNRCWGSVYVGDDSLNRAIGAVRKLAVEVAGGSFEVETIPRTGYRLLGDIRPLEQANGEQAVQGSRVSRRTVIAGAVLIAAGTGGLGLWSVRRAQAERRYEELMDSADQALDYGSPLPADSAIKYLQPAVAMRPDDAKAQGLLAYAQSIAADSGDPAEAGIALQRAEQSARAALALDPKDPNALVALVRVQQPMLDLAATEDRLREILAAAPHNMSTMKRLWDLLQSTGQSRAAWAVNERAIAFKPLAAANNYPKAQLLWILGRNAEADRAIDSAMLYWPAHPFVRFARFTIYAFTGRPRAALAMLDDEKMTPQKFSPAGISTWRVSLAALDQRTPQNIAAARAANLEAVSKAPALASQAFLALAALGEADAAFDIANEFLLFRRPIEPHPQAGSARPTIKSTGWRFTPWLFTPPVAAMRADPRFTLLCDGIGLTEYWAKRGIKPDYQLGVT